MPRHYPLRNPSVKYSSAIASYDNPVVKRVDSEKIVTEEIKGSLALLLQSFFEIDFRYISIFLYIYISIFLTISQCLKICI